jgi:4-aminobutyrate--pyruvate transaminase
VFGRGFTYVGHPVGCAVALEALAVYEERSLPAHVADISARVGAGLERVRGLPLVDDVRIEGLLACAELIDASPLDPDLARAVAAEAEACGVLFRVIRNSLAVSLPHVASAAELDRSAETLRAAMLAVAERITPDGAR